MMWGQGGPYKSTPLTLRSLIRCQERAERSGVCGTRDLENGRAVYNHLENGLLALTV